MIFRKLAYDISPLYAQPIAEGAFFDKLSRN